MKENSVCISVLFYYIYCIHTIYERTHNVDCEYNLYFQLYTTGW